MLYEHELYFKMYMLIFRVRLHLFQACYGMERSPLSQRSQTQACIVDLLHFLVVFVAIFYMSASQLG